MPMGCTGLQGLAWARRFNCETAMVKEPPVQGKIPMRFRQIQKEAAQGAHHPVGRFPHVWRF